MDAKYTGKKIAEMRKEKGWTQKEIGEKLHVSVAAVSKWERGLNYPDLSMMEPLADLLGISVPELLGIENESADKVIKNIVEISNEEKEILNRSLWRSIGLILVLFTLFVILIKIILVVGNETEGDSLPVFVNGITWNLMPLMLGFTSWILAVVGIISGRKVFTDKWKKYSLASIVCCLIALYFPISHTDLLVRIGDMSAIEDTAWAYHFAAIGLILGTGLLNVGSWVINKRRE